MLLKKFILILCSALLLFSMTMCSDSENKTASDDMQLLTTKVYMAMAQAMAEVQSSAKSRATQVNSINYTGIGWSATGSYTYDDVSLYPYIYNVTMTWSGFTYQDVTLSSGTVNVIMDAPSSQSFSYDYTGLFVVIYQGSSYNISWDVSADYDTGNYTYSGSYTVNGSTYQFTFTNTAG